MYYIIIKTDKHGMPTYPVMHETEGHINIFIIEEVEKFLKNKDIEEYIILEYSNVDVERLMEEIYLPK